MRAASFPMFCAAWLPEVESKGETEKRLTSSEREEVTRLSAPPATVVFATVRRQGEEELSRPVTSLFWSGICAGLAIAFSPIMQGALHAGLPATEWRNTVADFGYTIGFLIVVLGRFQLFTEQTVTAVVPVFARPTRSLGVALARLWAVVLVGNMVGALVAALIMQNGVLPDHVLGGTIEISAKLLKLTPGQAFAHGVPAGFLIGAVSWLAARETGSAFFVVFALTYAIALGDFTHVIAGGVEAFLLVFAGLASWNEAVFGLILPTLAGNILGGTGLFGILAYAQVREEL